MIDFKNKFETYLSGQTTCVDVIKYNNSLPTKKYRNVEVIIIFRAF